MPKYYRVPRSYQDEGEWEYSENPPSIGTTIYEPEDRHVFSGLYDGAGEPLYRAAMNPIGFLRREDD